MKRALVGTMLALSLAAPAAAGAPEDETPTIALVSEPEAPFALRLAAELEALGFRTVVVLPADEPSPQSLESAARAAKAMAAVRAVDDDGGVEVWLADRVTGKTVIRKLAAGSLPEQSVAALRAVELLRASLLEVDLPTPSRGEVAITRAVRTKARLPAPVEPRPLREAPITTRLSLGPGALLSPGGLPASGAFDLGLSFMPSDHVGLAVSAAVPMTRSRVERPHGSADLEVLLVGAATRFAFTPRDHRWVPSLDLGVSAVSLETRGQSDWPYVEREDSAVVAAPFARAGLAFAPTRTIRLRADVLSGVLLRGASIQFAGREVAAWGRPFALLTLGLDLGWF